MIENWFIAPPAALLWVAISATLLYFTIMLFARCSGVRSFAELSTFDIAVTVALGSLLASVVVSKNPPLVQGMVAVATLYTVQLLVSRLRTYFRGVERATDNRPILLMGAGGRIKRANLGVARVTEDDLRAQLRGANVSDLARVHAVVMEGTGKINVLHGDNHRLAPDAWVLQGVRDYTRAADDHASATASD